MHAIMKLALKLTSRQYRGCIVPVLFGGLYSLPGLQMFLLNIKHAVTRLNIGVILLMYVSTLSSF